MNVPLQNVFVRICPPGPGQKRLASHIEVQSQEAYYSESSSTPTLHKSDLRHSIDTQKRRCRHHSPREE